MAWVDPLLLAPDARVFELVAVVVAFALLAAVVEAAVGLLAPLAEIAETVGAVAAVRSDPVTVSDVLVVAAELLAVAMLFADFTGVGVAVPAGPATPTVDIALGSIGPATPTVVIDAGSTGPATPSAAFADVELDRRFSVVPTFVITGLPEDEVTTTAGFAFMAIVFEGVAMA